MTIRPIPNGFPLLRGIHGGDYLVVSAPPPHLLLQAPPTSYTSLNCMPLAAGTGLGKCVLVLNHSEPALLPIRQS